MEELKWAVQINISGSKGSISILRGWERVPVTIKDRLKSSPCTVAVLLYLLRDSERSCSILNP